MFFILPFYAGWPGPWQKLHDAHGALLIPKVFGLILLVFFILTVWLLILIMCPVI